jgi:signal transduction histidine kinase
MERFERRTVIYWLALGSLGALCCVLAVLQYRWIGEISRAEQDRLKAGLGASLSRVSQSFNSDLETACSALLPSNAEVEAAGREEAYSKRYQRWRNSARHGLFADIVVAVPAEGDVRLNRIDQTTGRFSPAEWPSSWQTMRERLRARLYRRGPPPSPADDSNLIEVPRFAVPSSLNERTRPEQDWLILEVNVNYVRATMLPALLGAHLASGDALAYDAEVFVRSDPSQVIYRSRPDAEHRIGDNVDASVTLFGIRHGEISRRAFRSSREYGGRSGEQPFRRFVRGPEGASAMGPMPPPQMGRWQLVVQSRAGSLAALVDRTRRRNLVLSGAILVLLVATLGLLLRFSRKAQQLAELQLNFVAGVSHELRTPLTVIRTAAFNLKGKLSSNPQQVERYGLLIQDEAEKLTAMVEQVLRFAGARAGRVINERTPLAMDDVFEHLLGSRRSLFEGAGVTLEKRIEPDLPLVLGDEMALRHAIQNLLDNAVKYGANGSRWIGLSASKAINGRMTEVEVRVSDRGPGIPADEQSRIFDAFFRGRRAIEDQIHGTGLGLNLVKKIAEAHGGSVRVISDPSQGTEFVMRIPAAPPELRNEFAHSFG